MLLSGCQLAASGPASVPGSRSVQLLDPVSSLPRAALTHEGGIVFGRSLDEIQDAGKRVAASTLQIELSLALRVERTMRDAALLASSGSGAFYLLAAPAKAAKAPAAPPSKPDPPATGGDPASTGAASPVKDPGKGASANAKADAREATLREAVGAALATNAAAYHRRGVDTVELGPDGSKSVTTDFDLTGLDGDRAVAVVRAYDAYGSLVSVTERLEGGTPEVRITAEQTKTYGSDGREAFDTTIRLALPGGDHVITWRPFVTVEGTMAGTGLIRRPDGTSVPVDVAGTAGELEVLTANDAAAGIHGELRASLGAPTATLTIDAGAAGSVRFEVPADAQGVNPAR
ncbi:MAG: hypothetical protein JWM80_4899 [Cyanobacteria bacterium RYN_339]|nr:hypothetical protein [Cyanobacteria bacterium RYN_339]